MIDINQFSESHMFPTGATDPVVLKAVDLSKSYTKVAVVVWMF